MSDRNIAMGDRIRRARKSLNLTQQEFAERLNVTQPTVHRWEKGFYDPDENALRLLAQMTDLSPAYFRYGDQIRVERAPLVPVIGYVGVGAEIDQHAINNHSNGATAIEAPSLDMMGSVAAIVRGDSLYPVYQDGDVIFYLRHGIDEEAAYIGRECVVQVAGGPLLLKRVMRGSERGSYLLLSYNASPMDNVRLQWASPVRWIKRA